MKKSIIGYIIYILILLAIAAAVLILSAAQTAKYEVMSYTVCEGDTYDILADRLGVREDARDWRERVKQLNGRNDSGLYAGETIYVLVEEGQECFVMN